MPKYVYTGSMQKKKVKPLPNRVKSNKNRSNAKVVNCIELMRALTEALQQELTKRRGEDWTDFEYIFDSVSGMYMVKAVLEGEEIEEFMTFEDLGSYNLLTSKFITPQRISARYLVTDETTTSAVASQEDSMENLDSDMYDFLQALIEGDSIY